MSFSVILLHNTVIQLYININVDAINCDCELFMAVIKCFHGVLHCDVINFELATLDCYIVLYINRNKGSAYFM